MRFRRFLPPTMFAVLAMILSACASSPGKLAVNLGAVKECQRLGRPVPVPDIQADTDYRDLSAQALAALNKANRGSAARTACENKVVSDYAKAK
jgi:hypothetical protein